MYSLVSIKVGALTFLNYLLTDGVIDDTKTDSDTLVKKILNAKLFEDPGEDWGSWKRSVKDIDGEVLCG